MHKKILEKTAKKLSADAKHYHKEAAHAKGKKKKHDKVEEKEAKKASKITNRLAKKAHEY